MTLPDLLAVFAHPDDEALVAGGVLARHAASGARTGVVTTTWSPDSPRAAELAASLRILGAGVPRMLGHADARVPGSAPGRARLLDVPFDEAVGQVVRHMREFRPEVVVTHDAYGQLTGHPDHVHTHRVVLLAAHAAGLGHLYPEAGEPWQPRAVHLATHPDSGIAELGPLLTRVGKKLLSAPDEHVDAAVAPREVVRRARPPQRGGAGALAARHPVPPPGRRPRTDHLHRVVHPRRRAARTARGPSRPDALTRRARLTVKRWRSR